MERKGRVAKATHVGIPDGLVEEEHGREAFAGPVSHLYRTQSPTAWVEVDGPLRPAAYDLNVLTPSDAEDPVGQPVTVLANQDLRVSVSRRGEPMPFARRNADGDEIVYVHAGEGVLQTDYGPLDYRPECYLVLPRGTTHRWVPAGSDTFLFIIESTAPVSLPDFGLLGRHAVVDPKVLHTPEPYAEPPPDWTGDDGRWRVRVKRRDEWTTFVYPFNPFTVVGWAGDLAPYRLDVSDIRPVVSSRFHLPPSAHTTFRCGAFDIATFVPRPFETDPESIRVPFFHANVDNDEVIFYSRGDFFSRKGIAAGWITHHPAGVPHGPQPGAAESAAAKDIADEIGVMIECRNPLDPTDDLKVAADSAYTTSWARGLGLMR